MITILPNWHPIFVHFTIGLLGMAVVFYFASALLMKDHRWKQQWQHMANWSLWSGCLLTILTVFAGWHAYNTVTHDTASHAAMTLHRNWALGTAGLFLILGLTAINIVRNNKTPRFIFLFVAAIAGAMLMMTGFLGGEAVYRHGLGVMSLPVVETEEDGHHHNHGSPKQHDTMTVEPESAHHLEPSIDTEMNEHLDDTKLEPTTPHEHHH